MKILMINPVIRPEDKPRCIPHGLALLTNIIRKNFKDIEIEFLDINAHRYENIDVKVIIKNTYFDVVMISGLIPVYKSVIDLSKFIRMVNPNAIIIAGGSVAMSVPRELLKHSEVDIICTGEGEITVVELLKKLKENKSIKDVKGIAYKKGNRIFFNENNPLIEILDKESVLPAYDILPMEIYLGNTTTGIGRDIDFLTSRGCFYKCTFCMQPWGRSQRLHSVNFLMKGIKILKEQYNVDFITFLDDEFMGSKRRVIDFCKARNKYYPNLLWSCTGRTNITARNEDLIKLMRKSGCTMITYGFESASPRMLKSMQKAQTPEQMKKTVEISRKYGLPIPSSFIIGMPGEDNQSCDDTVNFCLENNLTLATLMYATPYPGTEIFDFAVKTKRINDVHEFSLSLKDARDFTINLTDYFTDKELINKHDEMVEVTTKNYASYITYDEIEEKLRNLYGPLMDKQKFDKRDMEHRIKHGGINVF